MQPFNTSFRSGKKLFETRYQESSQKPAFMTSSLSPKQKQVQKVQEGIKPMPQLKHGVSEGKAEYLKTSKVLFYPIEKHKKSSKVLLPTKPHDSGTMKDPNFPETHSRLANTSIRQPPGSQYSKTRSQLGTANSNIRKQMNSRKSDKTVKFQIKNNNNQDLNQTRNSDLSNNIMVQSNATAQNQYFSNQNNFNSNQTTNQNLDCINSDYFNQTDPYRPSSQQINRPSSRQTLSSFSRPVGSHKSNRLSDYSNQARFSTKNNSIHGFAQKDLTPADYFQNFMESKKEIFQEGKKLSRMSNRSKNNISQTTKESDGNQLDVSPKDFVTKNIAQIEAGYIIKPDEIQINTDNFLKKNNTSYKNQFTNTFIKEQMHQNLQNKIMKNSTFQYNCLMKSSNLKHNTLNNTINISNLKPPISSRSHYNKNLSQLSNTTQGFHKRNTTQKLDSDFIEGYGNDLDNFDENISFSKKSHQELNQGSTFYNDIKNRIL